MFTGLVEAMGRVVDVGRQGSLRRLGIRGPWAAGELARGDSVSVDGACLTVTGSTAARFRADVIPETLERTTLGRLVPGAAVNLERALRVGDRLGGHWVQGHVDGIGTVVAVRRQGGDHRLRVSVDPAWSRYLAYKGSIALSGVSLTISALEEEWFEVALIPETLQRTTLGQAGAGDRLNVEVDLLARYLERLQSRES